MPDPVFGWQVKQADCEKLFDQLKNLEVIVEPCEGEDVMGFSFTKIILAVK